MPAELRIRPRRTWEVVAAARGAIRGGADDVLRAVMSGAPGAELAPDGVWRVRRPDDGDPWFTGRLSEREIVLGVSFSAIRFLRNFADLHQQAVRIGQALEADVHCDDTDVRDQDLGALLKLDGPYLSRFAAIHREVLQNAADRGFVPLEYSLAGQVDQYSVAFAARVEAPAPALAWGGLTALRVEPRSATTALLLDGDQPLLRVGVVEGAFQVVSAYGMAPFSRWARAAVDLADAVAREHGGTVLLAGLGPLDPVRAEVDRHLQGLGCDWVGWMLARSRS